jgi:ABC-type transport system substrate-binding protein
LIPGLATSWKVDDADKTKWIFTLRPGVKFHDGSDFDADAVVWNVNKVLDKNAPHFDARQVGVTLSRMPTLSGVRKIDAMTVEFTTNQPDSFLPINLTNLFMASPAQWEKVGKSWANFAGQASGTGPWKMTRFVPRERLELVRNTDYWNKDRVPKTERMVLLPIPEATARTAALLSGQVDWIEEPSPDALAQLKSRGMQIVTNSTPHTWPWQFSLV